MLCTAFCSAHIVCALPIARAEESIYCEEVSRTLHCSLCHSRIPQLEEAEVRMSATWVHSAPAYPQTPSVLALCMCVSVVWWVDAPGANPYKEIMCPKCNRISIVFRESANKYKQAQMSYLAYNLDHTNIITLSMRSVCHLPVLFAIKQSEADDRPFTFTRSHALTHRHKFTHYEEKKKHSVEKKIEQNNIPSSINFISSSHCWATDGFQHQSFNHIASTDAQGCTHIIIMHLNIIHMFWQDTQPKMCS